MLSTARMNGSDKKRNIILYLLLSLSFSCSTWQDEESARAGERENRAGISRAFHSFSIHTHALRILDKRATSRLISCTRTTTTTGRKERCMRLLFVERCCLLNFSRMRQKERAYGRRSHPQTTKKKKSTVLPTHLNGIC